MTKGSFWQAGKRGRFGPILQKSEKTANFFVFFAFFQFFMFTLIRRIL